MNYKDGLNLGKSNQPISMAFNLHVNIERQIMLKEMMDYLGFESIDAFFIHLIHVFYANNHKEISEFKESLENVNAEKYHASKLF